MDRTKVALVVVVFLLGLAIRLYPLTQTQMVMGVDGYYHLETAKEIIRTGFVPSEDRLSYGGRPHIYAPGFHIFAAAFSVLSGVPLYYLALFIPMIFYFFTFLVAYEFARRRGVDPMLAAAFIATIPVFTWRTTITFLTEPLWSFLVFSLLLTYKEKLLPVIIAFALAATHSIALAVLPLFAVAFRKDRLFSAGMWLALLVSVFFWGSVTSLYQNVPTDLRAQIFEQPNLLKYVERSGLQGLLALITVPQASALAIAWFFAYTLFVTFGFFELDRAIGVSALLIAFLSAKLIMRFGSVVRFAIVALCFYWSFTQLAALDWAYVPPATHGALLWANQNTLPTTTIASVLGEGYWVVGISQRPDIMDGHFIGGNNVEERWSDLRTIFTNPEPQSTLAKYNARFLLVTWNSKYLYPVPKYTGMKTVFEEAGAFVYSV